MKTDSYTNGTRTINIIRTFWPIFLTIIVFALTLFVSMKMLSYRTDIVEARVNKVEQNQINMQSDISEIKKDTAVIRTVLEGRLPKK